jgi:glyoxylase-like metal-dependent hydrolase (beta-lactamase superfamily II)
MSIPIADRWFTIEKLDDGITFLTEPHVDPLLRCNIWHVRGRDRDLLIDTGLGVTSLREAARHLLERPVAAVATHVHLDHVGGTHEFDDVIAHRLEAGGLESADPAATLVGPGFDPHDLATLEISGYPIEGPMLTAIPRAGYDVMQWRLKPARVTRRVDEGDVVDLGDRLFRVLHLPGHSPGGIGLLEEETQILFSGDALYDGFLIDKLPHSSIPDYRETMRRLKELPVRIVHAGHCPSFGRERLIELADEYLAASDGAQLGTAGQGC